MALRHLPPHQRQYLSWELESADGLNWRLTVVLEEGSCRNVESNANGNVFFGQRTFLLLPTFTTSEFGISFTVLTGRNGVRSWFSVKKAEWSTTSYVNAGTLAKVIFWIDWQNVCILRNQQIKLIGIMYANVSNGSYHVIGFKVYNKHYDLKSTLRF